MLGAVFNILHGWLAKLRAPKTNSTARLAEAVVIVVISVGFMFALPYAFPVCAQKPPQWEAMGMETYGVAFLCPEGEPLSALRELRVATLSNPVSLVLIFMRNAFVGWLVGGWVTHALVCVCAVSFNLIMRT